MSHSAAMFFFLLAALGGVVRTVLQNLTVSRYVGAVAAAVATLVSFAFTATRGIPKGFLPRFRGLVSLAC